MARDHNQRRRYMSRRDQILTFSSLIFQPDDWVEVRKLAREVPGMKTRVEREWHRASDLPKEAGRLHIANTGHQKFNIHVGVNPRADHGLAGDANIACGRCLFADFDFEWETDYLKYVWDLIDQHSLPEPTVTVLSGHGVHCYWRLTEALGLDKWREMQERLILTLGCDDQIKNPERLLRLPGYVNWKKKEGF